MVCPENEPGRFLSADPNVQFPESTQGLNRYSYVNNNPLSYTDPSGFFIGKIFKEIGRFFRKFGRAILGIAAAVVLTYLVGPVAAGFISGVITGGDLKSGIIGALTAAAFSGLHNLSPGIGKTIAHGIVGGVSSVAQGGKFGAGFLSAGFTQSLAGKIGGINARPLRTIAAAFAGGAASVLGGGKFANGAVTGAFSRLFNDELTKKLTTKSALEHYKAGSGDPLRIGFSEIDTSDIMPSDFPGVESKLQDGYSGPIDTRMSFSTSGDQSGFLGDITLRLQGTLTVDQSSFSFNGTLKSYDDYYDFNKSNRSFLKELITAIGRNIEGKPFYVEIRGTKPIIEIGRIR